MPKRVPARDCIRASCRRFTARRVQGVGCGGVRVGREAPGARGPIAGPRPSGAKRRLDPLEVISAMGDLVEMDVLPRIGRYGAFYRRLRGWRSRLRRSLRVSTDGRSQPRLRSQSCPSC